MQFSIEVNGQQVTARRGETIKNVLDRIGIHVPTLCYLDGFTPTGGCRMCVVEVEGIPGLVPSCSHLVSEWMKIQTNSAKVLKSRKILVELLLTNHPDDCLYCERSGDCGLQDLAAEMNIRERKYFRKKEVQQIDKSCTSITRDPAKCVMCNRCIRVCDEVIGVGAIDIVGRGSSGRIGTMFNKGLNTKTCVKCGQCIMVCPTAALTERTAVQQVIDALHNPETFPVIQFSPTVPATIAEMFNLKSSKDLLNLLRAALKAMGFRQVFDISMAADVAIMEEATELLQRLNDGGPLPMFTACCPSWVKYVEECKPPLLPYLSRVRSPQQIMGRLIKSYITTSAGQKPESVFVVSVMPCTSAKHEASLDLMKDGATRHVDAVITTRELARIIRSMGIDFSGLEPEPSDTAFGMRSSAGNLFGISGGHLEGLLRTAQHLATGSDTNALKISDLRGLKPKKESRVKLGKHTVQAVALNGLASARPVIDEIASGKTDYHLVEVMTCPYGCINGGGQKMHADEKNLKARMKALYDVDEEEMIKVAHRNPIVNDLYEKFLAKPGSAMNNELLHTSREPNNDSQ